jgi:DNA primase
VTTQQPPTENVSFGAPQFAIERDALKAVIQFPELAAGHADDVGDNDFTHPLAQALWRTIVGLGIPTAADPSWVARINDVLDTDDARRILSVAAVEPLKAREASMPAVVAATIAKLQARTIGQRITDLKSKLQRTNPVEQSDDYNRMFGELIALEQQHRTMRDRAIGA